MYVSRMNYFKSGDFGVGLFGFGFGFFLPFSCLYAEKEKKRCSQSSTGPGQFFIHTVLFAGDLYT